MGIELLEQRALLSATVATGAAVDEGDWTAGHAGRIEVANVYADARPLDRYTFEVTATTRLSASLAARGAAGGDRAVRLLEASGSAVDTPSAHGFGGIVLGAGRYTLAVAATRTYSYVLSVHAVPAHGARIGVRGLAAVGAAPLPAAPLPELAAPLGPFSGAGNGPSASARYVGTAAGTNYYTLQLDGSAKHVERVTLQLRSPSANLLRATIDGHTLGGPGHPTQLTVRLTSADQDVAVTVANAVNPGDPVPFELRVLTAEAGVPPYHYHSFGGSVSTSTPPEFATVPAGSQPIPYTLDVGGQLTGDANGWSLGPASAGDHWTFATDGTGVRTVTGIVVPFTWTAGPGELFVTYAGGSNEQALTGRPGTPDWTFDLTRGTTVIGELQPD